MNLPTKLFFVFAIIFVSSCENQHPGVSDDQRLRKEVVGNGLKFEYCKVFREMMGDEGGIAITANGLSGSIYGNYPDDVFYNLGYECHFEVVPLHSIESNEWNNQLFQANKNFLEKFGDRFNIQQLGFKIDETNRFAAVWFRFGE